MRKIPILLALFTLLWVLMAVPLVAQADTAYAIVCDLHGQDSDTLMYIDGAADSVMASVDISQFYSPGDSVMVTVHFESDTSAPKVDVSWATKATPSGSYSSWTAQLDDLTAETDSSFYAVFNNFARYLVFKIEGVATNAEDTQCLFVVSGTVHALKPKPIYAVTWRTTGTILQEIWTE